jgi:predicted RNA binding protein YcfA (HicA-like mRNA interferase family)
VTWAEVIRKLKAAGFVEVRSGKGSHRLLKHPTTGKEVWVAVHTKKDAGRLGNRILREAGIRMTMLYPIVLETEESGAVSAYVPGLPVYAAADSHAKAERAIRAVLTAYLHAHPATRPDTRVRVARVSDRGKARIRVVGIAALVGAKSSEAKARASRANGRLGGRPPKNATRRTTRTKASR